MNKICINCGKEIIRIAAKKYCTGECKRLWEKSIQLLKKRQTKN